MSDIKRQDVLASEPDERRRRFLIGAGLGGVGSVAVLMSGGAINTVAETEPSADSTESSKGYRETEHVRRYYGTTRI